MKLYPVMCEDPSSGASGVVATFTSRDGAQDYIDNDTGDGVLTIEDIDSADSTFDDKVIALAAHLGGSLESINDERRDNLYSSDDEPGEYLVLTDSEADEAFKESVENYVEECILDQLPIQYRCYFDTETFTRDVEINDGRGPSLAGYDSEEHEERVDDTWYYIYRVN